MRHPVYNIFLTGFLVCIFLPEAHATLSGEVKKANELYRKGQFNEALDHYQRVLGRDPRLTAVEYDLGTALYKKGDYAQSVEHLEKALLSDDPQLQAKAQYNLGNGLYKSGIAQENKNLQGAIDALEKSLTHYEKVLARPQKDPDAQYNDDVVKKELKRLKEKKKQQDQQKQQEKNQQKDQQEKQQNQNQQEQQKDQEQNKQQNDQKEESTEGNKPSDQKSSDQKNSSADKNKDENNSGQKQNNGQSDPSQNNGAQGATGQSQGEMTPKEADAVLGDYERNEEPRGMLYFAPQSGKEKPVGKDW